MLNEVKTLKKNHPKINSAFFKGFARNLRDGGILSAAWYLCAPKILKGINLPGNGKIHGEIHVLSGKERLIMALWMAASWIAATGAHWRFVIHDDGSLDAKDVEELHKLLTGCRVITDAESTSAMQSVLAEHPSAWRCRNLHPLCRKLFDVPHYAEGDRFLTIDTDIIFYGKPERLLAWLQDGGQTTLFLEDVADATLPSAVVAAQMLGRDILRRVNTGIVAMPKSTVTFDDLEHCLSNTRIMEENPWFIEQSLYAVLASLRGQVELLGKEYYMPLSGKVPSDAVARHYMGKVRHMFYSEGIPSIIRAVHRSRRKK